MGDNSLNDRDGSLRELVVDALLHSYAIVYFAQRRWLGALLLAGSLCWPVPGLIGLAGLSLALGTALVLGFDRHLVRSGAYLFNSLLISLVLGHFYQFGRVTFAVLTMLLVISSIATLLVSASLISVMFRKFELPALSLPFVIAQFVLSLLLPAPQVALTGTMDAWTLSSLPATEQVLLYFRSLGGILCLPEAIFGLLAFLGLLVYSRLLVLYAAVGLIGGMFVLSWLPLGLPFSWAAQLAFNFMYCGVALGGIFFIPSRASLLLVVFGSAVCAVAAAAVTRIFGPLGAVPVALPFNLTVLLLLYAFRLRTHARHVQVNPFLPLSPEENFSKFHAARSRFPDFGFPTIHCPFLGERVVTQGVDGPVTHRHNWKYALDFEVLDEPRRRTAAASRKLEDYYTFNTPVLCPEDGTVARTIDHIEDRPIGSNNFADNWGNLVIIRLDSGLFVKLCHLRQRSITVKGGERVRRGQIIGYCGNSGRSPVPHLHVQLQTSPHVGAATIPFRMRHYFERVNNHLLYHATGIPAANTNVQAAAVESCVAKCFDNIPRREFTYRLTSRGRDTTERITCGVDESGNYVFENEAGDRMVASAHEFAFFSLEYQGGRSVLYWLWLGLSRVPFISNPQAQWHDSIDMRRMLRPWARLLHDLLGPFHRYSSLRATGKMSAPNDGIFADRSEACVDTTFACQVWPAFVVPRSIPKRIRTYVSAADWVIAAVVDLDEPLLIEQVSVLRPICDCGGEASTSHSYDAAGTTPGR